MIASIKGSLEQLPKIVRVTETESISLAAVEGL